MPALSRRLDNFQPSKIAEIFALAARLKEQGEDIADLSTGEPDFPTPEHVCEAGKQAIDQGVTRYTTIDGTSTLKRAIQAKFRRDNGLDYALDEIVVDAGAKPLLANALTALLDDGDEVIIPSPCWPSHPGAVRLCGGVPVIVPGEESGGFKITPCALEAALTARTRVLMLNSPANPTGAVYGRAELRALADVLVAYPDLWIIADDIYEKLVYDDVEFATLAQVEPGLKSRTLTINGLSKAFAMTGWRVGYAGGPPAAMAAIRSIMTQATGNPSSISQFAAAAALEGEQGFIADQVAVYQARRDRMVAGLNLAPGLAVRPCEGAFYLFVNCSGVLGKRTPEGRQIESSSDFARYLLEQHRVAIVPGIAFEYDPYFRLSFAASDSQLDKALKRITAACEALD